MTKPFLMPIGIMLLLLSASGCKVNVIGIINAEQSITVAIYESGRPGPMRSFTKDSPEFQALLAWARRNESGWAPTTVTFVPFILISGKEFSINIRETDAILGCKDGQYIKTIPEGEYEWFEKLVTSYNE